MFEESHASSSDTLFIMLSICQPATLGCSKISHKPGLFKVSREDFAEINLHKNYLAIHNDWSSVSFLADENVLCIML